MSSVLNQNGTLNGTPNYFYPYGGKRSASFSALTTKRFTGQYHEAGLPGGKGLSYYNARWYDAHSVFNLGYNRLWAISTIDSCLDIAQNATTI